MIDEKIALEHRQSPFDAQLQRAGFYRPDYGDGYFINNGAEEEGVQVDWAKWARAIFRYKRLVVCVVAIGTALSLFAAFRTRDSYQAFTVISVGKEDTAVIKAREGNLIIQDDESLKTKMYLLQSNSLAEEVIADMKLDQSEKTLNPGWKTLEEIFSGVSGKAEKPRRSDLLSAPVSIGATEQPSSPTDSLGATEQPSSPTDSWRLAPFVDAFKQSLSVELVVDTRLLRIAYTHPDPDLAAAICNYLAYTLVNRNIENKSEKFKEASSWLDRSTRELKARAERAEQALANYTRTHNNIAPQGKGPLSGDRLLHLQAEVTRAETDRIIKESLYEDIRQGRVEHMPQVYSDANFMELQRKLGDLMVQAAQFDVNYGPDNPQTIEVQQQISSLRKQIESRRKSIEVKSKLDFNRAIRDERSLKSALEGARGESAKENLDMVQYGILQQEVETTKALYRNFAEKSADANFELAQQQNNLRVVEPARAPREAAGPNRKLWTLIGFALSLTFGIGLALLLDVFDHNIRSVDDLSRRLQLPALAVIPTIDEEKAPSLLSKLPPLLSKLKDRLKLPFAAGRIKAAPNEDAAANENENAQESLEVSKAPMDTLPSNTRLISVDSRSPAAEAYRLLRTSIMLSENGVGSRAKTWLITSSQIAEGKTTTAVNVAISIAQLGRSVLIVDCDLRTPTVHEKLCVEQKPGLSAYLSGNAKLNSVIRKSDIHGLSLIPGGATPHNPCDLISSQKMKEMMETLAQRYDYIILDSPPLINLADPLILSTIVDNVIFVVNGGKSNWESVSRARQELSSVGANVFGVVLNNVAVNHTPYYGYHS